MDKQANKTVYNTIIGGNSGNRSPNQRTVVVSLSLPRMGEWDFKWCVSEFLGCEYGHYGYRLMPKSNPVNVQVYGDRKIIENLARSGKQVVCELELVVKKLATGKEYILVNLYLTNPNQRVTHEFAIVPAPQERPWFIYSTNDMYGTGVLVRPF